MSHCPPCLPKAKSYFPVWPLFGMWCHFSSALQHARLFGLFSVYLHHHNVQRTLSQFIRHPISPTAQRPNIPSQHYLLSSLIAASRTSSPETRSWPMILSMHPQQRMGSSASLGGPHAKPHGYSCFWFGGAWARALPLSRTQQHCRNLIQSWAMQHPRAAPSEGKAEVGKQLTKAFWYSFCNQIYTSISS